MRPAGREGARCARNQRRVARVVAGERPGRVRSDKGAAWSSAKRCCVRLTATVVRRGTPAPRVE
eukprot:scaffold503_cov365-Prasinococcus_capsulatus_cf.AAC.13